MENCFKSTNDIDTLSALQYAVSNAYPKYKIIELLWKYSAEVNATNSEHGFSILHCAVLNCVGKEVIELLLHEGVNKQNSHDGHCTPLLYAFRNQSRLPDYAVIELLLKHGADIHARDFKDGPNTALQYAVKNPTLSYELLELLLKYKPNVNVINFRDGMSVLQYAVKNPNSNPKIIELLLASGANVHARNNKDGYCTALLYAVRKSTLIYDEIELLLRYESDVDAVNSRNGFSVIQYVVSHPNVSYEVVELLLEYNATVDCFSTMDCVIRNTHIDPKVVELMYTMTNYNTHFFELADSRTNFEAVKILVRLKRDHFPILKDCLIEYSEWKNSPKICFEILKWLVLKHFKKDPKCKKKFYTVQSVLEARYMKLISGHKFSDVFFNYLNECILEIISMKLDGFMGLLLPEVLAEKQPSIDTTTVSNQLLSIWSKEDPSMYLDIIESNIKSKDLLDFLLEFQISTRLTFEGSEKELFLGYLPTLRIVEHLPLKDMLSLVEAFYGFFKNRSTLENLKINVMMPDGRYFNQNPMLKPNTRIKNVKPCLPRVKLARACKKQRLN